MEFLGAFDDVASLTNASQTEICLLARSNVGKSSLVNALAKKKIARVSKIPGRTQTINIYSFTTNKFIVDLPGYGYARVSKEKLANFNQLLETYINKRWQLKLVLQICDASVVTDQDVVIANELHHKRYRHCVIFNKIDRLSKQRLSLIKQINVQKFYTNCDFFYVSCKTRQNIDQVYRMINAV